MFARFGKILVSGPSNVAITNAAARIYSVSTSVAERYNNGRPEGERMRRRLVVRVYPRNVEEAAFWYLLQYPKDFSNAGKRRSKFEFSFSRVHWLRLLFSELSAEDAQVLHDMQQDIFERRGLEPIRDRIMENTTWEQYLATGNHKPQILSLLDELIQVAEFVCATPACSENDANVQEWKATKAMGVLIDEAGNMNRSDLACVWGNCLLPCFLVGDTKQFPPPVMSAKDKDEDQRFYNRLALDGFLSPLELFQASGIPVHQLYVQLRMPNGIFDIPSKYFYPDVPVIYSERCRDINSAEFTHARAVETFARKQYPGLMPPPAGKCSPIFLHCVDSQVFRNELTSSKRCPDQVEVALHFIAGLVRTGTPAPKVNLLCTYSANVAHGNYRRMVKDYREDLADMPGISTIDNFQGKENDIIVAVLGTNRFYGPGFTAQKQRLNVLLTRARCALVLVGDLEAAQWTTGKSSKERSTGSSGETVFINVEKIRSIYKELEDAGRVVTIPRGEGARAGGAGNDPAGEGGKRRADDVVPAEEESGEGTLSKKKKKRLRQKASRKAKAAIKGSKDGGETEGVEGEKDVEMRGVDDVVDDGGDLDGGDVEAKDAGEQEGGQEEGQEEEPEEKEGDEVTFFAAGFWRGDMNDPAWWDVGDGTS